MGLPYDLEELGAGTRQKEKWRRLFSSDKHHVEPISASIFRGTWHIASKSRLKY